MIFYKNLRGNYPLKGTTIVPIPSPLQWVQQAYTNKPTMYDTDHFQKLKKALDSRHENIILRIHRANSWLHAANTCYEDDDQFYIFSWIAFNALYGKVYDSSLGEKHFVKDFFRLLLHNDDNQIQGTLWEMFTNGAPRVLLSNKFVFPAYWRYKSGDERYADWETKFTIDKKLVHQALLQKDTLTVLSSLFDRMYVLRNQMLHGSATYKSDLNREQIITSRRILEMMLPLFMEIILKNPHMNWGEISYKPQNNK